MSTEDPERFCLSGNATYDGQKMSEWVPFVFPGGGVIFCGGKLIEETLYSDPRLLDQPLPVFKGYVDLGEESE